MIKSNKLVRYHLNKQIIIQIKNKIFKIFLEMDYLITQNQNQHKFKKKLLLIKINKIMKRKFKHQKLLDLMILVISLEISQIINKLSNNK